MEEKHKLQSIKIEGFKSIRSLDMEIKDLNILIGQNGAGKSNFMGIFKFVKEVIEHRLQVYTGIKGGADKMLFYGSKITQILGINLLFPPYQYGFYLNPTSNDNFIFNGEYCDLDISISLSQDISNGILESGLFNADTDASRLIMKKLQEWVVYHFQDTSDEARIKKFAEVHDSSFLKADAGNLAPFLMNILLEDNLNKTDYYGRIVKTIQLVIPYFKNFIFKPNSLNRGMMMLEWQDKYSDNIYNASDLSDGSLRFIGLATLLLQPNLPNLILIDEPELGLHPAAIAVLAGLIKKASKHTQVIVSTQSVNLVNEFEPEDIIVVDRKEVDFKSESTFTRLEEEKLKDWLERYSIGELWDKNIIGGRP